MFKELAIFRLAANANMAVDLEPHQFQPCGATQEKSIGWVPVRGHDHGALIEHVGTDSILKLMIETKSVPSEAIQRKVDEEVAKIEAQTGRKPGKKETRELKEDARIALLPLAFPKRSSVYVWIDHASKIIGISTTSSAKLDLVLTALVKSFEGISLQLLQTTTSAASMMSTWLVTGEDPVRLGADRSLELKACDESKAKVKYDNHAIEIDEVRAHIGQGKIPTKMAMTWDGQVSFVLTESMAIKKIDVLDVVTDSHPNDDAFDADVTLFTGAFKPLIQDLIAAHGGEVTLA
jgi:recombination associated protein RdgC